MELAGVQLPHARAIELRQRREQHRPDRHVDADPERVGSADHAQHPALSELFDEPPILGQHAGVMHSDARAQELRERLAERRREAELSDELGDLIALLAGRDLHARQRLRALHGCGLREVHDVDRRLASRQQVVDRLMDRGELVVEVQRHRTFDARHGRCLAAGAPTQVCRQRGHIAQGRRHQDELRLRQREQRNLPRPPAIRVGVEVELIHHDLPDVSRRSLAQSEVGEDLGRAADDRSIRVHRRITRDHADVLVAQGGRIEARGGSHGPSIIPHRDLDERRAPHNSGESAGFDPGDAEKSPVREVRPELCGIRSPHQAVAARSAISIISPKVCSRSCAVVASPVTM